MKTIITLLIMCTSALGFTPSGKNYKTNGSQSDVQAAIDAAPDDGSSTIQIPDGSYNWTGKLTISKAVSLAGASAKGVTIKNENGNGNLIEATSSTRGHVNIYWLNFVQVADNGGGKGFCINCDRTEPSNYTVLVHDCSFDEAGVYNYSVECRANGIIFWNNHFEGSGPNGVGGITLVCMKYDYAGWNTPDTFGANDHTGFGNTYVEDCTFSHGSTGMINFDMNSRLVLRHCIMDDAAFGSHGQETSPIGAREWEFYSDRFQVSSDNRYNLNNFIHIRGGAGIITDCDVGLIPWNKGIFTLTVFSITRGANDGHGGSFCPIEYPAPQQTGWGWADNGANWGKVEDSNTSVLEGGQNPGYFLPNGKGAVLDPVYIWGNRGEGTTVPQYVGTQTYTPDNCNNGQVIDTYLKKDRDYYVNVAKPGWTPYTYPHPLHTQFAIGGGGGGPNPTPTPAPTPGPSATPTPTPAPTPTPTPPPSVHRKTVTIQMESQSPITVTIEEQNH